jgi:hypothetical protein
VLDQNLRKRKRKVGDQLYTADKIGLKKNVKSFDDEKKVELEEVKEVQDSDEEQLTTF